MGEETRRRIEVCEKGRGRSLSHAKITHRWRSEIGRKKKHGIENNKSIFVAGNEQRVRGVRYRGLEAASLPHRRPHDIHGRDCALQQRYGSTVAGGISISSYRNHNSFIQERWTRRRRRCRRWRSRRRSHSCARPSSRVSVDCASLSIPHALSPIRQCEGVGEVEIVRLWDCRNVVRDGLIWPISSYTPSQFDGGPVFWRCSEDLRVAASTVAFSIIAQCKVGYK